MVGTGYGIRFVKCPKCLRVLTEFPDVPVYKCGGCGTILRAKSREITEENVASGSEENNSRNLTESNSLNKETTSSVSEPNTFSPKLAEGMEEATHSDLQVSSSIIASDHNAREEFSEHGESGTEDKGLDGTVPNNEFALNGSDTNLMAESHQEESIPVKADTYQNEEIENFPNPSPEGLCRCTSSDKMEESSESNNHDEENVPVKQDNCQNEEIGKSPNPGPEGDSSSTSTDKVAESSDSIGYNSASTEEDFRLTSRSSNAYDGSVSSIGEGRQNRSPNKYLLLSKRTFRRKMVLGSVDSTVKGAGEGNSENCKMAADAELQPQAQNVSSKSSNWGNEFTSRYRVGALERDTTFGSEDFHSVLNSMERESEEEPSKSLPVDPIFHEDLVKPQNVNNPSARINNLDPDQMSILRKVDELRDELTGFLAKTAEGKGASHLKHRLTQIPVSEQPNCSSLACPHNVYSKSGLPCIHELQMQNNEPEKMHFKEKKQIIKRYCQPVSRGAPFVICYNCWELLQLPADFLVTRKRLHKLRCGSCSEILVFSFRSRDAMAPQSPAEVRHPPSEVDAEVQHPVREVNNSNNRVRADPISFSDECGLSFAKSYSSDSEAGPVLNVSRNSSYSIEEQDRERARKLRLHRLMGYSSASELLFRSPGGDDGCQSTAPSTPQFYRPPPEGDELRYELNRMEQFTPSYMETEEEDESPERLRTRKRGLALRGLLKKGVRELSHGLESMKLKIHSNG